ncbi:hypothetical protein HDU93_004912, partial [Gonapodya sp. JEL0774]
EVTTAAVCAIDGIARLRNRLQEVLTALNAASTFGVLMVLLRKTLETARTGTAPTRSDQAFFDALLEFLSFVITNQMGSNIISSCGLVPIMTAAIDITNTRQTKNISRVVGMLDAIVFGYPDAYFDAFVAARGLDLVTSRIKREVDIATEAARQNVNSDAMEEVTPAEINGVMAASVINQTVAIIPNDVTALLRSLLKLVLHIQQTSGSADRVRNLIEGTIPHSILQIYAYSKTFGPSVFGLATNVMSAFIHNEPTSLQILQELKLPQTFLLSIVDHVPASAEVVSAIPTAWGAM